MPFLPKRLRDLVLLSFGQSGFTPPPHITHSVDQMISEARENNWTIDQHVESGIAVAFDSYERTRDPLTVLMAIGALLGVCIHRIIQMEVKGASELPK